MWKRHLKHCIVKCVENISRKTEEDGTLTNKAQHIFWFPVEDIKISDMFYKIQNFLGTPWASIITIYLIKLLSTGPFVNQKGTSVQNYLVKMIHTIHTALDNYSSRDIFAVVTNVID